MSEKTSFVQNLARLRSSLGRGRHVLNLAEKGWSDLIEAPPSDRQTSPACIAFTQDDVFLVVNNGDEKIDFDPESEALAAAIEKHQVTQVDMVFLDKACLDIDFTIPDGPMTELRTIVDTEVRFQSPFEDSSAIWFWVADEVAEGWKVRAGITLRDRVDRVLDYLTAQGIKVSAVRRADATGTDWAALPDWARTEVPSQAYPRWMVIPAVATALFLLSALSFYGFQSIRNGQLENQVADARATLANAARGAQVTSMVQDDRQLSYLRLMLVGQLAAALPDDTWLENVALNEDTLEITGYSPSAAETTRQLSQLGGLTDIRFSSPVTRDNSQGIERFRIAATLTGLPQ